MIETLIVAGIIAAGIYAARVLIARSERRERIRRRLEKI